MATHANTDIPQYISITEAARILGLRYQAVYLRVQSGELTGYRVGSGGRIRLDLAEVLAHLRPIAAPPARHHSRRQRTSPAGDAA